MSHTFAYLFETFPVAGLYSLPAKIEIQLSAHIPSTFANIVQVVRTILALESETRSDISIVAYRIIPSLPLLVDEP